MKKLHRLMMVCAMALGVAGCTSTAPSSPAQTPALRVGLTPDLPPLAFLENGALTGLEMDLARKLAVELGRPIEVVSMPWKGLLQALHANKIDIIMGGITITESRKTQVAFTEPLMESGLMALIRSADRATLGTPEQLKNYGGQIGVMPGTTSDAFVQRMYPRARRVVVQSAQDAALVLQRHGMDAFVYDLPAVVWLHSRNEASTALISEPLHREQIGWALRRDDQALKAAIDGVLAGWKKDGTLQGTIQRWIPYYQKVLGPPAANSP